MKPLTIADSETIILGLQDEIRRSEESRYDHRLHGLLLVAHGMTCPEVAALLAWIERQYGIDLGKRQCQRLFRRLGFQLRKPRPAIAQADLERQKGHKRKLQELMDNDEVDLWATDEVHFQQHGSRCRMWVPPETQDPVLLHHPTRRSVGYFGAVRLKDERFRFSRETGKFNAMTFFAFLKTLRRTSIRTGRRVVVITDNARYHHARLHKEWRESHAQDFPLDCLPPYSPELNPIVGKYRLWMHWRRVSFQTRSMTGLSQVKPAVNVAPRPSGREIHGGHRHWQKNEKGDIPKHSVLLSNCA